MVLYINTKEQNRVEVALVEGKVQSVKCKVIKSMSAKNKFGSQVLLPLIVKLFRTYNPGLSSQFQSGIGKLKLMATIQDLELEINKIKERNKRVEREKSWEVSWTRKLLISLLTYFVISLFFLFAGISQPFVNSIVPAVAFILSTLSVPLVKNWWLKYIHKGIK